MTVMLNLALAVIAMVLMMQVFIPQAKLLLMKIQTATLNTKLLFIMMKQKAALISNKEMNSLTKMMMAK